MPSIATRRLLAQHSTAERDPLMDMLWQAFIDWYPKYETRQIRRLDFQAAVEVSFPLHFLSCCRAELSKSTPKPVESQGVAWLYRIRNQTKRGVPSFDKCFREVKEFLDAVNQEQGSGFDRVPFEHRPIGRAKDSGRWGG
jgi:hypothetical protein